MLRAERRLTKGALAAVTYRADVYSAATNGLADEMADVMRSRVGVADGDLRDGIFTDKGTGDRPTIVGASGDHPSTGGLPVADPLSVAWFNNFGTSDTPATHFMEAAAIHAENRGLRRGKK